MTAYEGCGLNPEYPVRKSTLMLAVLLEHDSGFLFGVRLSVAGRPATMLQ